MAVPPTDTTQAGGVAALRSVYAVPKMDCPSEERLIRMGLGALAGILDMGVDLQARRLTVLHTAPLAEVSEALASLKLGAKLLESAPVGVGAPPQSSSATDAAEQGTLRTLLAINAVMFVVELGAGWWAQSTGLIADSLDMLADAAVYGISLYAVGRAAASKLRAAHLSGWLQMALAAGVLVDVLRRLFLGSDPYPPTMMGIALLALLANITCLALIARHRAGGVHMRASWIFSTNDVLANLGVILAGVLVAWTESAVPDLVVGVLIASLVSVGALRILRLR